MQLNEAKKQHNQERINSRPTTSYIHHSQLGRTLPDFRNDSSTSKVNRTIRNRESSLCSRSERVNSMQKEQE